MTACYRVIGSTAEPGSDVQQFAGPGAPGPAGVCPDHGGEAEFA